MSYGKELILDLHDCDVSKFNRLDIGLFFDMVCKTTDMVACDRYWWDDIGVESFEQQTLPHTKGTSAVQFILTSSIVIHTLELLGNAYINIFTCKGFDPKVVEHLTRMWFGGVVVAVHFIERE